MLNNSCFRFKYRICFCIFGDTLLTWWIFGNFSLHYFFPATRSTENRYFTEITHFTKLLSVLSVDLFFYNVLILAYDIIERKTKIPFNSSIPKLNRTTDRNHNIWGKENSFFQMENDVIFLMYTLDTVLVVYQ